MGEIAEMLLDGTLCEACGSYIDDEGGEGFPRYCSKQCATDRGALHASANTISARALRWLTLASQPDGVTYASAPAYLVKLERRGLVANRLVGEAEEARFFITDAGRAELMKAER